MKSSLGCTLGALLIMTACHAPSVHSAAASSVETGAPNTHYQPAFAGQTRVASVHTHTPYQTKLLAHDLGRPWGMVALPDGQWLITEKSGFLWLLSANGQTRQRIRGLPRVDARGQGGLLDVVLDPQFAQNQVIYWTFSEPVGKGNLTAVSKGILNLNEGIVTQAQVIFRAAPAYDGDKHYGSRLAFGPDGYLYVSTGERSDKKMRALAQQGNNDLGKILRLTKEGHAAPDNPLAKRGFKPEIYAYGLRNPQGLAFDEQGQLWSSEHGPRGGDEINRIVAAQNYGWGDVSYGIEYLGTKVGQGITRKQGTEQPVYYWDPVISPSGMVFYSGSLKEWQGNLFVAALSGQHIVRLVLDNGKVVGEERLLVDKRERFRDVANGVDGALYAITDSGKLYRIATQ